jgi:hypothetical protein
MTKKGGRNDGSKFLLDRRQGVWYNQMPPEWVTSE